MNTDDLDRIEETLDVSLPRRYRSTMLDYLFPAEHEAAQGCMPDDVEFVLKANSNRRASWPRGLVVIGDDGGEEQFLLDCRSELGAVIVYELETEKLRPLAPDFDAWLSQLDAWHREVADDQAYLRRRYEQRRWWQFWIGPPNA
jgi:hypothetical protein